LSERVGHRDPVPARTQGLVTRVDKPDGRYALRRGGEWITVTPADTLTSMGEELSADVR
jgi:hypothetical protein